MIRSSWRLFPWIVLFACWSGLAYADTPAASSSVQSFPKGITVQGNQRSELTGVVHVVGALRLLEGGDLLIRDATVQMELTPNGDPPLMEVHDHAHLIFQHVTLVGPELDVLLSSHAWVEAQQLTMPQGGIYLMEDSRLRIRDSQLEAVSVTAKSSATLTECDLHTFRMAFPKGPWKFHNLPSLISHKTTEHFTFSFHPPHRWTAQLQRCRVQKWWFDLVEGSDLTLDDVEDASFGLIFRNFVGDVENLPAGKDLTAAFVMGDIHIKVIRTNLLTMPWNLYLSGPANVDVFSSVLGDVMTRETAEVRVTHSILEGPNWESYNRSSISINGSQWNSVPPAHLQVMDTSQISVTDTPMNHPIARVSGGGLQITNSSSLEGLYARGTSDISIEKSSKNLTPLVIQPPAVVEVDGRPLSGL